MKETKLVPKRRFKEFIDADAWEQRKFAEITFPVGEKNHDNLKFESYSITNENGFIPQDVQFEHGGTMRDADKRMYYIVSPKSFAYNPARINVGSIGYQNLSKNVIVSSLYEIFKTTDAIDDRFLWHWFKSPDFQKLIEQLQEGGVRLYFYYDKLCMGTLSFPHIEEQKRIGVFLDHLDILITLHQRKCEKLKAIKSAYLTEMFPQKNEKVPKRRFAGFTDAWEQRKLGDMVTRISSSSKFDDLPRVEYEDIVAGLGILNKDIYQKKCNKMGIEFFPGDILFGKLRPYLKNWLLAQFRGVAVGDFWVLRAIQMNNSFLFILMQTDLFQIVANQSAGSKMPRSDWNIVSTTEFWIPSNIKEQQKIGLFFENIDNLITLHQRKLEKLKNLKAAYLQEMFV